MTSNTAYHRYLAKIHRSPGDPPAPVSFYERLAGSWLQYMAWSYGVLFLSILSYAMISVHWSSPITFLSATCTFLAIFAVYRVVQFVKRTPQHRIAHFALLFWTTVREPLAAAAVRACRSRDRRHGEPLSGTPDAGGSLRS